MLVEGDGSAVVVLACKVLLVVADDAREEGAEGCVDHLVVKTSRRRERAGCDAEGLAQLEQTRLWQELECCEWQRHVATAHVDDHQLPCIHCRLHRLAVFHKRVFKYPSKERRLLFRIAAAATSGKQIFAFITRHNLWTDRVITTKVDREEQQQTEAKW